MTASDLLALLAFTVLILQNAARIPVALAELLDACQPLVHAARALTALLKYTPDSPSNDTGDDIDAPHGPSAT